MTVPSSSSPDTPPTDTNDDHAIIESSGMENEAPPNNNEASTTVTSGETFTMPPSEAPPPSGIAAVLPAQLAAMGGKGKTKILAQAKRQFGKVSQHLERNLNRMIDQRVNKMFGISNVTSGGKNKRQAK